MTAYYILTQTATALNDTKKSTFQLPGLFSPNIKVKSSRSPSMLSDFKGILPAA
jgi:hypothetical protein